MHTSIDSAVLIRAIGVVILAATTVHGQGDRPQPAILGGNQQSGNPAIETAVDATASTKDRVAALESLAQADVDALRDPLLQLVQSDQPESVRMAAITVAARIEDPRVVATLIFVHNSDVAETLKRHLRSVVFAHRHSALAWLQAVDRGDLAAAATPIDQIRRVALLNDPQLNELVRKHWGPLDAGPREDALAEVRRLNKELRSGTGDAANGRLLFRKHCAACHQLFGDGKQVGPSLTTFNRADRLALLVSLVAPSSVIRKEYATTVVLTKDGRVLTGLPIKRDASGITLVNQMGEAKTIATSEIESSRDSNVSLMPAGLYRQFTPEQFRDLFAWLQSSGPEK
jgi:putative heme-binding domain-containing protein